MKKNIIVGSILLIIGIVLVLLFLTYNNYLMLIALIGMILIFLALKPLLKDLKQSKLFTGLLYLLLSSLIIIYGFLKSENLFLGPDLWQYSTFTNLLAEAILLVGTIFFLNGILILIDGLSNAKLILGISCIFVCIVLWIVGVIYLMQFIAYVWHPMAAFFLGLMQGYLTFGFAFLLFGFLMILNHFTERKE